MILSSPSAEPAPAAPASTAVGRAWPFQGPVLYLAVVVSTIVAGMTVFVGLLLGLDFAGLKPPPAFTNSYCIDAKLEFLRRHPPLKPTHLVVGSSIAWRNIDAGAIVRENPHVRPLNGAFCGLAINQSAFVARFLVDRLPGISDVLLLLDPFDMSNCRASKTAVFDKADVGAYLSGAPDLDYYFKYFDLLSLLTNAVGRREAFTAYGDGPLDTERSFGLVYGPPRHSQPECLAALTAFALDMQRRGIALTVTTMPLMSGWSREYDPDARARKALAAELASALAGTQARLWDAWSTLDVPAADYTDAVHLRWSATGRFTRRLVTATGFGTRN
jgi:hypothetical protein